MKDQGDFRVGDVLSVGCPFTPARVERVVPGDHVAVRWPWWQIDGTGEFGQWDGVVVLGVGGSGHPTPEAAGELFRTDPPPDRLKAGDVCRVGVPPTVVHVTAVDDHDPPLKTVWLPRPTRTVTVLRRGLSPDAFPDDGHLDGPGFTVHPGDGIPFTFERLMRPYEALQPGDEVGDGRAWRFDGPWDWTAFDGAPAAGGPAWPLVGLTRAGTCCSVEEAAAVAASTANGSHGETLRAWTALTATSPTP
ncbi:hypothetical protein [Streptomyces sp. NPDC097619]|uniref:hypothetical protein n=1 Tax=Streptomyces sp. NPDC097619 TaxID=3157228 RepID=UPI0033170715